MNIKLFADSASLTEIQRLAANPNVSGFTTNPSLMRKAGVTDYATFAKQVLQVVPDKPVSFEVLADEPDEIYRQARIIAGWGENVYVKVPVQTSKGESLVPTLQRLRKDVRVNVTAVMTSGQAHQSVLALRSGRGAIISIFAGRIADTGQDPVPLIEAASMLVGRHSGVEILWASSRELLNIMQAEAAGCHIITVFPEILRKLKLLGKDLKEFSRETVEMFCRDTQEAGYTL